MSDEKDDLENLVKSPGWLRFKDQQETYWRDTLLGAIASAANDSNDAVSIGKIRQIVAAQQAVQRCLASPQERLRHLTEQDTRANAMPAMSRGGF
jgi:hypothetical protein